MSMAWLEGRRVLVAEDEFFMAMDLEETLQRAGATVVGPAASVAQILELVEEDGHLDAAVLDVNLGGEMVYPVADRRLADGMPIVFAIGYSEADLPPRFGEVLRCEKPVATEDLVGAVSRAARLA